MAALDCVADYPDLTVVATLSAITQTEPLLITCFGFKLSHLSGWRFVHQLYRRTARWRLTDGECAQNGGSGNDYHVVAARVVSTADCP
jgi:hypothetical protein